MTSALAKATLGSHGMMLPSWKTRVASLYFTLEPNWQAAIAQLGERQTEDLKVPGWIPGLGMH